MNREQKFLLRILREYINNECSLSDVENSSNRTDVQARDISCDDDSREMNKEIYSDLNWDKVLEYSNMHQVTAIVYYQCRDFIPQEYMAEFSRIYAHQLFYYTNMGQAVNKIDDALSGIEHMQFKGRVVAELYPEPSLRTMGDVDILIHSEDREKTDKALVDAGFTRGECGDIVWDYSLETPMARMKFEIHENMFSHEEGLNGRYDYFRHFWEHVNDGMLDWNFHLVYLISHLEKHMRNIGAGFRQFMDIAIVSKNADIDWDYIHDELAGIKLLKFAKTVFALNERWFGVPAPSWGNSEFKKHELIDDDFAEIAVQQIFANGIFGFDEESNKDNSMLTRKMMNENVSYGEARRNHLWHSAFPGYEHMRSLPYCKYVDGRKILLPMAYVHRFFYRYLDKDYRENYKRYAMAPKDGVEARVEMLKRWGIE